MSRKEIYSEYLKLCLTDKLLITTAILYDLDVGDYSSSSEGREGDWREAFIKMTEHLETEIGKRLVNRELSEIERKAKAYNEEA